MLFKRDISAIDLFCGIGGLSYGFKKAGIEIKAGIDIDKSCRYAFETNCKSKFINKDISKVKGDELKSLYDKLKWTPSQGQFSPKLRCASFF